MECFVPTRRLQNQEIGNTAIENSFSPARSSWAVNTGWKHQPVSSTDAPIRVDRVHFIDENRLEQSLWGRNESNLHQMEDYWFEWLANNRPVDSVARVSFIPISDRFSLNIGEGTKLGRFFSVAALDDAAFKLVRIINKDRTNQIERSSRIETLRNLYGEMKLQYIFVCYIILWTGKVVIESINWRPEIPFGLFASPRRRVFVSPLFYTAAGLTPLWQQKLDNSDEMLLLLSPLHSLLLPPHSSSSSSSSRSPTAFLFLEIPCWLEWLYSIIQWSSTNISPCWAKMEGEGGREGGESSMFSWKRDAYGSLERAAVKPDVIYGSAIWTLSRRFGKVGTKYANERTVCKSAPVFLSSNRTGLGWQLIARWNGCNWSWTRPDDWISI